MGDRVRVNDSVPMWVDKINVYYTSFKRLDNSIEMHANSVLSASRIRNETWAEFAIIEFPIRVGYRTSAMQLDKLTTAVIHWIRERKHVWKDDFIEFYIYDMSVNEYMDIAFWIGHRFTFHNGAALWGDMSKLRMFMLETMRRLGIEYIKATQPIYLGPREEVADSLPGLPRGPHQPYGDSGDAESISNEHPRREDEYNHVSDSLAAFRDEYSQPVQQQRQVHRSSSPAQPDHDQSKEQVGRTHITSNRHSAPDLANLEKRTVSTSSVDGDAGSVGKDPTYQNLTQSVSEDVRRQLEKALLLPPLTPQRLGLLRIDDAREAAIELFDAKQHAKNFVDLRAGGVHHTWNWVLPLHQRSTVFTSPEHLESLLRSSAANVLDPELLKGLGYGLSAKAYQTQKRRGLGKRNTPMRTPSSSGLPMVTMPGSFGGIKLKTSEHRDPRVERMPLEAMQALFKRQFKEKIDFKKMTPGQKLIYSLLHNKPARPSAAASTATKGLENVSTPGPSVASKRRNSLNVETPSSS